MSHELDLLKISYDEMKQDLDKMKEGSHTYKITSLNLKMIELKIELMEVDIHYIITTYLKSTGYTSPPIPDSTHDPAKSESVTS